MTKQEFNQSFAPMCKALNKPVNAEQAQVYFDEFQHHDKRDFSHACRELSMGNAGYLPKLVFFRDNVIAAKEMRLEGEKVKREEESSQFWHGGTGKGMTPEEFAYGKAQIKKLKAMLAKAPAWQRRAFT